MNKKNSKAAIVVEKGSVFTLTFVNNDGYLKSPGVGSVLENCYPSYKGALKISSLGSIDSINASTYKPSTPVMKGMDFDNIHDAVKSCLHASVDYLYVFYENSGKHGWQWNNVAYKTSALDVVQTMKDLKFDDVRGYVSRDEIDFKRLCSYRRAVDIICNNTIMVNSIEEIDRDFYPYISDNDEDEYSEDVVDTYAQFFLTDATDDNVEFAARIFPELVFKYSDLFSLWVLCVPHHGTSWTHVFTEYIHIDDLSSDDEVKAQQFIPIE